MSIQSTVQLNNGVKMPRFGLGVYKSADETASAVKWALKAGYRHIDTATFYGNERYVGQAIRESGIPRKEIFVTTKLWNNMQRENRQREALEYSLKELNLGYIDLYLIHWPVPGKFKATWKLFEQFYEEGMVRAIGVSNFLEHHLDELLTDANIVPAVNQFECHPYNTRESLRKYCKEKGIVCEAWSPLARGKLINEATIQKIADKYGKTVAQIILRWDYQSDIVTIPKSVKQSRIIENSQIFDFALAKEEIQTINGLNKNLISEDPDNFNF